MAISFNQTPSDSRVPFAYVEFDSSKAQQGPSLQPFTTLVLGGRLTSGTVAALLPTVITSVDAARAAFGAGSMLHGMARTLFANDRRTKAVFVGIADDGSGVPATGTIIPSGTATEAGTIALYIAGRRITYAVSLGDTAASVATGLDAAITADTSGLPVSSSETTGTITLTALNDGEAGNDIDVRFNYFQGEVLPAGILAPIVAMASGANNPDLDTAFAVLGETHYNIAVQPYSDASNLAKLKLEADARFGPERAIELQAFTGVSDTFGNLLTFGTAKNDKHTSFVGFDSSPTPHYELAAACAGIASRYGKSDPARPFQTLPVIGVLPPAEDKRFTLIEQDLLLRDGISTFVTQADGTVRVQRLITSYQSNAAGAPDSAYLDVNTMLTLGYVRYDFRTQLANRFPRHKLANDGTKFGAGQAILTPKIARGFCLGLFRGWEELGLVEGFDQFKEDLIVERNAQDPNRLDFLLSPDLVNQFRVGGVLIGFLL
jgi:phage tail sheath gpL-like